MSVFDQAQQYVAGLLTTQGRDLQGAMNLPVLHRRTSLRGCPQRGTVYIHESRVIW
jgi:hypothetical protein